MLDIRSVISIVPNARTSKTIAHVAVARTHANGAAIHGHDDRTPLVLPWHDRLCRTVAEQVLMPQLAGDGGERLRQLFRLTDVERTAAGQRRQLGEQRRTARAERDGIDQDIRSARPSEDVCCLSPC